MRLMLFLIPRLWMFALVLFFLSIGPARAQDDILASLTLEQKIGQMFMVSVYGQQIPEVGRAFLQQWQPGGIVLFSYNAGKPGAVARLTNDMQQIVISAGGLPMFIAVDQEGGLIAHLQDGFTQWPVPMLITATGDEDLAFRFGRALGEELRAVGVNMNLAPVADLYTNISNPIIGRRSFGSDPQRTGRIVAAVVHGMQSAGVMATAKHFPGHGDTSEDSHITLPIVRHDRDRLDQVELVPFKMAIEADVSAMMIGHIWFPALEPEPNLPASLSPNVISGLLRGALGYDGLVMTDALEMDAIDTVYGYNQAVLRAIKAGIDLIAFGSHTGLETQAAAMQTVIDAVRSGEIAEERINESVRRILQTKAKYNLLNWQPTDASAADKNIHLESHARLVSELFMAGTTLVYDHADKIPLPTEKRLLIIYPANRPAIRQECGAYRSDIKWLGVSDAPAEEEIAWAQSSGQATEVVVVFTQNADINSAQQGLVKTLVPEKTVVVALWSPFDWLSFRAVSAYLATYSPLSPGIKAACAILFGAAPARGRLPVSLSAELPAGAHQP